MSGRTEKDKQKAIQEKHQAILCELLKLDDNKYCVDCDAKGKAAHLFVPAGTKVSCGVVVHINL